MYVDNMTMGLTVNDIRRKFPNLPIPNPPIPDPTASLTRQQILAKYPLPNIPQRNMFGLQSLAEEIFDYNKMINWTTWEINKISDADKLKFWSSLVNGHYNHLLKLVNNSDGTFYYTTDDYSNDKNKQEFAVCLSAFVHPSVWYDNNDSNVITWSKESDRPYAENGKETIEAVRFGDLTYFYYMNRTGKDEYSHVLSDKKAGALLSSPEGEALYFPQLIYNEIIPDKDGNIVPDRPIPETPNDGRCPCKCYETIEEKRFYLVRECSGANCYPVKIDVSEQVCDYNYQDNEYQFDCEDVININELINERY